MTIGRVTIRGGFLLLMAVLFYFDTAGVLFWFVPAAALHEAGHLLALRLFGARVQTVEFSLRGVDICLPDWPALSYGRDFAATLAGPLFSLSGAALAAKLADCFGAGLYVMAGIAFTQGLFNLLPARTLDGGRLLRLALSRFLNERLADRMLGITTVVSAVLLAAAGLWLYVLSRQNFTLGLSAVYLALTMFSQGRSFRQGRSRSLSFAFLCLCVFL